ncbi:MAG: FmdB family zinc ribbon protein [Candidatus Latescibacterota bacterium]
MPTYEYQCQECDHRFEVLQRITADPLSECPECAGKVERLISSGAGFLFKGTGFYTTDYRSEGYKKAEKADTSTATGTSDKQEGKETKEKKEKKEKKESNVQKAENP